MTTPTETTPPEKTTDSIATGDKVASSVPLVDIKDYRGKFSPARDEVTRGSTGKNIFDLSSYYWYPEGFMDIITSKDVFTEDTYNQVTGSFDTDATGFLGVTINNIGQEFKKAGRGLSKLFGASEHHTEHHDLNDHLNDIPYIKITEFQTRDELSNTVNNMKVMYDMMNSLMSDFKEAPNKLEKLGKVFSKDTFNDIVDKLLKTDSSSLTDDEKNFIHVPSFFYEGLLSGLYTAQYKVPYFNQPNFLNAMGDIGWEAKSMRQNVMGNMLSSLVQKIPGLGSIDIASRPKFSMAATSPTADVVTCEFYLHNYNVQALGKNLKFLHALTSGAFWVQSSVLQLPSNLYDIEVPGRFKYYYCKGSVKVDFAGKTRTLPPDVISQIKKEFPAQNDEAISKCPDAYKITLNFTSLLPNNLNVYMYYIQGKRGKVSVGDYQEGSLEKVAASLTSSLQTAMNTENDPPPFVGPPAPSSE